MNPDTLKKAFEAGAISPETYQAAMAQYAPQASQASEVPTMGPPLADPVATPPAAPALAGPAAPAAAPIQSALSPLADAPNSVPATQPMGGPPAQAGPAAPSDVTPVAPLDPDYETSKAVKVDSTPLTKTPSGDVSDRYDTKLDPRQETAFKLWKAENAPNDSGKDYDLRGAFKAGVTPDPETGHMPDTFKKPNHPTFSVESQYATGDNLKKAGTWGPDGQFIPPAKPQAPKSAADTLMDSFNNNLATQTNIAGARKDSLKRTADIQSQGLQEQVALREQAAKQRELEIQQDNEFHAKAMAEADQLAAAEKARAKEIANMKVDPNKGVKDMSAFSKVLAVIASGLEGAGAGIQGRASPNTMINMMMKKNEESIDAQKAEIQNKKDGWQLEHNVNAQKAARDGDWLKWRAIKRMESAETLKDQLATVADKTNSAQVKEVATQASLDVDQHLSDVTQQFAKDRYSIMSAKERAAAAASAAAAAAAAKTREFIQQRYLTYKDVHGLSDKEALAYAQNDVTHKFDLPGLPTKEERENKNRAPNEAQQKLGQELKQGQEDLKELGNYKAKVATISPSIIEGVSPTTRGQIQAEQERYKAFVYRQVAKMYKLDTTAQEPKNVKLIEHFAAPYLPNQGHAYIPGSAYEPIEVTKRRMENLEHDMQSNMTGLTGNTAPPDKTVPGASAPAAVPNIPGVKPYGQ